MATFEQNIRTIRSEGIYGTDIREAIAAAIEQSDDQIEDRIESIRHEIVTESTYMSVSKIAGTQEDYLLEITNPST